MLEHVRYNTCASTLLRPRVCPAEASLIQRTELDPWADAAEPGLERVRICELSCSNPLYPSQNACLE